MDHGSRDGGRATVGGAVHQYQVEGHGGAAHQTPGFTPPKRGQSGHVSGISTRDRPHGNHQLQGDRGGGTTIQRSRDRWDGLIEPPALAHAFWCGEQGTTDDCCRLCVVFRQRAPPMGRIPSADERPADCTGKSARGQAGRVREI